MKTLWTYIQAKNTNLTYEIAYPHALLLSFFLPSASYDSQGCNKQMS